MTIRKFRGIWIPAELWFSTELTLTEKALYLEIESLDNDFGCVATNKKLGEVLQVKPNTVSALLKSLEDKKFISISYKDYKTFAGRSIIIDRHFSTPPSESNGVPSESNAPPSKLKHSNTISNINSSFNEESTDSSTLYMSLVDYWLKELHPGFTFTGAQGKALKSLITKTKKVLKDAGRDFSDGSVTDFFKAMCQNLPEWYKQKDLNVIDSKFNEVISEIKSQQNGKRVTKNESKYQPQR